jgi:hypothetical protein
MKPKLNYVLHIQKTGGPVMTWNGERFTNNEPFKFYSTAGNARAAGKKMLKLFKILEAYKIWAAPKFAQTKPIAVKKNPSERTNKELDDATKKLEDFSGHPVGRLGTAYSRSPQKTGLIIGEVELIGYRAKRDGETARYGHHFKKASRPLLAVTSDGKQLHIVGGQYEFTEAGIEDR